MTAIPHPLVLAHLRDVGRWCHGFHRLAHPADDLTARAGRVLCAECADYALAWERGDR